MPSAYKKRKCAYCGATTYVDPLQAINATQFTRTLHSPIKVGMPPLCECVKQGLRATRKVKEENANLQE